MTNAGSLVMEAHELFLPWSPKGSQSTPGDWDTSIGVCIPDILMNIFGIALL